MALKRTNSDLGKAVPVWRLILACIAGVFLLSSCNEIERPKVEPFYAVSVPPPKQELRWSNGKMPKSLDPARAVSAPDTDLIRAIYDGLTDLDSKSLHATAAVAEKWEPSNDLKTWTFTLRKEARWSNGERVTADDFVRSWKRLSELREKAANRFLFQNIVGMSDRAEIKGEPGLPVDFLHTPPPGTVPESAPPVSPSTALSQSQTSAKITGTEPNPSELEAPQHGNGTAPTAPKFGVEAVNDTTLKVSLELPDPDFPKLVANPIFRPVYNGGGNLRDGNLDPKTVTNGPFEIAKINSDGLTVVPSNTYWNRGSLALESIRFVAAASPENALDAYKKGEVDVVTNAAFEPLALKLLSPYEDFRRTTHNALNFYEFNTARAPFGDRRVREALAIAIDRTKLTEGDLEGMMHPAEGFDPLGERKHEPLALDVEKAKQLMDKAGFPNGSGFPQIRLVVNRNDTQQRVARSVARMWLQNLNVETQIIVKEASEIDDIRRSGDFDIVRRGVVFPANDEIVTLASILGTVNKTEPEMSSELKLPENGSQVNGRGPNSADETVPPAVNGDSVDVRPVDKTLTEEDALFELRAIPLYYPTSYALVKPYVRGFEMNGLDAPSLKEISIDSSWQPKTPRTEP